jgi:hypothetical protein
MLLFINHTEIKVNIKLYNYTYNYNGGTRKRSWLRHYATSRKVVGSSPDEVDFFFQFT